MKKSRRPSRRMPPLNPLRAFAVSAKRLSFTLAAKEMCLSQGAVSRAVRSLENYFGFLLFERGVGTLILTISGARYAESRGKAFSAIEDATETLLDGRWRDTLTIQGNETFLNRWLLPRLTEFQAKNLDSELRLISVNDLVDFDERQIDVPIRYGSGNWPDHDNIPLVKDELRPVCSPRLLDPGKAPYYPKILSGQTLLHIKLNMDRWSDWFSAGGSRTWPEQTICISRS